MYFLVLFFFKHLPPAPCPLIGSIFPFLHLYTTPLILLLKQIVLSDRVQGT